MGDARSEYSPSALGGATQSFSGWEPKKLWHAQDGVSEECAWTEGFDSRSDGRSLIASDLDGDGDVDLLMLNRNETRLQYFRNDGEVGNAVTLRFDPPVANVRVLLEGHADELLFHRGFASSVPPELTRGAKPSAMVTATWPRGRPQKFEVKAGTISTLHEKTGAVTSAPFAPRVAPTEPRFPSTLASLGLTPSGKPTLVTLFLSGCEPCRKEAPALNKFAAGKKFDVLGFGVASTDDEAARIAKSLGFAFVARALPDWAAGALSTHGRLDFPTTLLFDALGNLERVLTDVSLVR